MTGIDKKNQMLIIWPVILIAVVAAWYFLIFSGIQKEQSQLQNEMIVLQEKLKDRISKSQIELIQTEIDSLNTFLNTQNKRIYPVENLLTMGQEIEKMVKGYGLRLVTITPDFNSVTNLGQSMQDISELPVNIVFYGTFHELTKFIDSIEDLPYVMRIDEVHISKPEDKKGILDIDFKGVIVLRKERVSSDDNLTQKLSRQA